MGVVSMFMDQIITLPLRLRVYHMVIFMAIIRTQREEPSHS